MKAKTFRKTFPMLPAIALTAATLALMAALPARATTFIKDVMLIGGTSGETSALKNSLTTNGWTFINYDLNKGCGSSSDYVYLLYKAEADTSGDRDYITGFYIKSGASNVTTTFTSGGKTYTLTPYYGGSHFNDQKGDLNSNTGESSASIHLYYTKDASFGRAVSDITFNTTKDGALGANGASSPGYDLNDGCGSGTDYIYMHVTTALVTYDLTYDLAGGTLSSANPSTYTANTATFTLNEPTLAGYTFTGWTWDGQTTPTKPVTIAKGSTGNKSYTANWKFATYTITYNLNSGTNASGNPASYTVETPTFTLANPTRTGYTFAGWTWSGQSTPTKTVTISQGSTGNKSYTANWTPVAYTITYNLNSGTNASGNPATYTVETATFSLNNPTRTGYTFTGWTWSGQSTPTKTVTIAKGSTGDKSFSATWNANSKGSFDACEGFANYITLSGWAYDPDEPSLSLSILVQVFRGDGGTLLSEHSLTADLPRADVNSRYGITGQHGFRTTILVAEAGTCTVKVWALDSTDDSVRTLVGGTRTAATTINANVVQLDYLSQGENLKFVTHEAQDGDVLVGSTPYNVGIVIADGATVTLFGAHVDNIELMENASAIRCRGDATLVLASGTENSATGNRNHPGVQAGPPGTTLVICGGGTLNAGNNDLPVAALLGQLTHQSAAGIGSPLGDSCGDIVIEGGTINATGGHGSPGIGASPNGTCGSVSISGGVSRVTATAGEDAPSSIGSGIGGSCGAVTIGGMEVGQIAQSPCTYDPKLNFVLGFDGNGAEGSMSGQLFTQDVAQSLNGPTFSAPSSWEFTGWNTSSNGNGTAYAAGQSITLATNMTLFAQWSKTFTLSNDTCEITLHDNDVLTGTGGIKAHVTIADGATVTLSGADVTEGAYAWAGITCEGDATIILVGDNAVKGGMLSPGISVPAGKTLTIQGGGSLSATGGSKAAGIGGGFGQSSGNIVIADDVGRVTATAGSGAPYSIGPGDGPMLSCGTVTLGGVETGPISQSPYVIDPSVPCTVRFDANGGTGGMADQTFSCGVPQSLAACAFTAPGGYLFGGWNTTSNGTGTAYANGQNITVSGDMTLYAQWSVRPPATVTLNFQTGEVTLYNNDVLTGTGGKHTLVTIADGATVALSGADIPQGHDSWAGITCEGDATIILVGDNAVKGEGQFPGISIRAGKTLTIQGDGSLSATGGDGSAGIGGGWGQSCGNIVIADGVGRVTATAGSDAPYSIGPGYGSMLSCGTVTIGGVETGPIAQSPYVFGSSIPCTIHFDANGGTGGMADQTFSCGVPQSLAACGFTAPGGYLFGGWNTAADGIGTAYAEGQRITVSGDMTLYAQWSIRPVATVTLDSQSGEVTLRNGDMLTGTGGLKTQVTIADGATVVLSGVNITQFDMDGAAITCEGDATIILEGDNVVRGRMLSPGISVPEGKTLTIQGGGSLSATSDGAAGIGGGKMSPCGNIVIKGGAITATGDDAAGIGTGNAFMSSCGSITIGAGITSLVASGTPCIGGENNPTITIAPGLVSEGSLSGGTFTLTPAKGYERWSLDNGVSGAWNATDASGIANVFRYVFNVPAGAFTNPPLLDIAIEDGNAVVITPPVSNTVGFAVSVVESSDVAGAAVTRRKPLDATGRTVFPMGSASSRFYRLSATEGEASPGGVQLWENGPYWAECNVGASEPEEFGYYFWWGDTVGYTRSGGTLGLFGLYTSVTWVSSTGEQMSSSPFSSSSCPTYGKDDSELLSAGYVDSTGNLAPEYDAATAHLGAPWRMPTDAEFAALTNNCIATWITTNGVSGRLVTGTGAYADRSIFLPAPGYGSDSTFGNPNLRGYYWSSTPDSDNSYKAWYLDFNSSLFQRDTYYGRQYGLSVRPVRDAD